METARVVPIPKSSQTSDPSNYRPVSLLSILSKLLEKHIQSHLLDHLADNCPVSDMQWGFLKGRSTTGALLSAVDSWHQILDSGLNICADLSKAFDKVPHEPLMDKLADMAINPHLFRWLWNYIPL